MKFTLRRKGDDDRSWPKYLFWGRLRTSTAALIIAFSAGCWLYGTYQPHPPPAAPETAVVPPGFVPDPAYTWVPRTNVNTPTETTPTTTESTTETSGPETSGTETPPNTTGTTTGVPTTVVDPDGPGPAPATTVTPTTTAPSATPPVPGTNPIPMPTQPGGR